MKKHLLIILLIFIVANAQHIGDWCGTIPALKDYQAGKLPTRPTLSGPEQFVERLNFRVHYTTQGRDRVSIAYAESAASAIQYCWAKQIDSLGWIAPAPDYGQGGDDRFDCYITALPSGILGVCYSENSYPNPYPNGTCAHIRISNSLDLIRSIKVVSCHEFNHAIQMRYSAYEESWWYENTATWIEDLCYDDINDYIGYLGSPPTPLSNPELPISTFSSLYQYAGAIWAMFLQEYYDYDCPRKIWVYLGIISGNNTISGMNYVLTNQYGSSLRIALKHYGLWRYFTNVRTDTLHYFKEAHLWPLARALRVHYSYPASGNQSPNAPSAPGGTNYIQFQNGGGKFFVSFDGQDGYQWTCYVVGYQPNSLSTVYELPLNSQVQANDSFFWQNNDHYALIPVVTQWESNTGPLNYNYSADIRVLHDVAIERLDGFSAFVDSGTVLIPQALVKNFGLYPETFPVNLTVGNFYTNTQNVFLNSGDSGWVIFQSCTLKVRSFNTYRCTTMLTGDERHTNDLWSDRIFVWVKDVACTVILEPNGNIFQGAYVHPKARVKNYGNVHEILYVDFLIGDWHATQRIGLAADLEFDLVFDSVWCANVAGQFVVKCSTKLTNDMNTNNDQLISNCIVVPNSILESNNITFKSPSITISKKKVHISGIENISTIEFEMFDIQGKMVYYEKPNDYSFYINKSLPTGCYIVCLKADNKYFFNKSIIIR